MDMVERAHGMNQLTTIAALPRAGGCQSALPAEVAKIPASTYDDSKPALSSCELESTGPINVIWATDPIDPEGWD